MHAMTPTQERLHAEAKERSRRYMMAARSAEKQTAIRLVTSNTYNRRIKTEWSRLYSRFDAHVKAWHSWKIAQADAAATPVKTYIRERAEQFGVTYDELMAPTRKHRIIVPKHQIMWEVKRQFRPSLSWGDLAKFFGLGDHTTSRHAVLKMDKIMGWEGCEET